MVIRKIRQTRLVLFGHFCFSTGSFLNSRLTNIRDRAVRQQLKLSNPFNKCSPTHQRFIDRCKLPFVYNLYGLHDDIAENSETDETIKKNQTSSDRGVLNEFKIDNFGSISIEHSNILNEHADCLLVPIPPNLTPHTGFGLKILELGGKKLMSALVHRSKAIVKERVKDLEMIKYQFSDISEYKSRLKDARYMQLGDVVITPTFGLSKSTLLAFVITPYYWEGTNREASLKLNHIFKRAMSHLNYLNITSVLSTLFDDSTCGYRPKDAYEILIEEAYESIIQVEEVLPNYSIRTVRFIDSNANNTNIFASTLENFMQLKCPNQRVLPAPLYYSRNNRRIIEFDESVLGFSSQYRKITYKRHNIIRRSKRLNWLRNIKPFMWRKSVLYSPPPLLLYKSTGIPSEHQLAAKRFYKNNITHELF